MPEMKQEILEKTTIDELHSLFSFLLLTVNLLEYPPLPDEWEDINCTKKERKDFINLISDLVKKININDIKNKLLEKISELEEINDKFPKDEWEFDENLQNERRKILTEFENTINNL